MIVIWFWVRMILRVLVSNTMVERSRDAGSVWYSLSQPSSWSSALGHPVGQECHRTRAALAHLQLKKMQSIHRFEKIWRDVDRIPALKAAIGPWGEAIRQELLETLNCSRPWESQHWTRWSRKGESRCSKVPHTVLSRVWSKFQNGWKHQATWNQQS